MKNDMLGSVDRKAHLAGGFHLQGRVVVVAVLAGLLAAWPCRTQAASISSTQAVTIVTAWLAADSTPMNASLSSAIGDVMAYPGADGLTNAFYVVSLLPAGYVIVAADDLAGSVISFSATGAFNPSGSFYHLLQVDLPQRVAYAQSVQSQAKQALAGPKPMDTTPPTHPSAATGICRVRVSPLITSHWSQSAPYNYYTPSNAQPGIVAVCLAEIIRQAQWPTNGIGRFTSLAYVNESPQWFWTIGGDGKGGPYPWSNMVDDATASGVTLTQQQAVAALCADVGITVAHEHYDVRHTTDEYSTAPWGTLPDGTPFTMADGLHNVYGFTNGGFLQLYSGIDPLWTGDEDLKAQPAAGDALAMINANLDAGFPVLLSLWQAAPVGSTMICDGYGYSIGMGTINGYTENEWMFHHINMADGSSGDDIWYTLPVVQGGAGYTNILAVGFNMMPTNSGEIVSGRVVDQDEISMPGITMQITDGVGYTNTAVTGNAGIYAFIVPGSADYTVSVVTNVGGPVVWPTGNPPSQTVHVGTSTMWGTCGNVWGVNFEVTSHLVGGQILKNGAPLSGAEVIFSNGVTVSGSPLQQVTNYLLTAQTDRNGNFVLPMPNHWTGILTPSLPGFGGIFSPPCTSLLNVTTDQTNILFAWSAPTFYAVSGTVFRADTLDNVTNAVITFTNASVCASVTAATDAQGNYVAYIPTNWTCIAIPSDPDGGVFAPNSRSYTNLSGDIGFQYYYWLPPATNTISGWIIHRDTGQPAVGVTLTTSDGKVAATDASGAYSITVPYLWSGSIAPSDPRGGVFMPVGRSYSGVRGNTPGQNYLWTSPLPEVSGRIVNRDTGFGVAGVTLALSDGSYATTTDVNGAYALILPYVGWSGALVPSFVSGGRFVPVSTNVNLVMSDTVLADWTWIPPHTIAGLVTRADTLAPVANVTITLPGAGAVTTDTNGSYVIQVAEGWAGTATPSHPAGGSFAPPFRTYSAVSNEWFGQDYLWTPPMLIVSGVVSYVMNPGQPLAGALLTFANDPATAAPLAGAPVSVTSAADGSYSLLVPFGWSGTVTPTFSGGGAFLPGNRVYVAIVGQQIAQNFLWAPGAVTISGAFLRADGVALTVANATVTFVGNVSGNPYLTTAHASSSGDYAAQVPAGWSGYTTLSNVDGGVFLPTGLTYIAIATNVGFQTYYWLPPQNLSVSGYLHYRDNGQAAAGVTVSSSDSRTTVTDANGYYTLPVPYLWLGTIAGSSPRGGVFQPDSYAVPEVHASVANDDFLWTPPTPQLSGRIVNADNGAGVTGVVVRLSDGTYTATTDVTGAYAVILPYKWWSGSLLPSYIPGGVFHPASNVVANVVFDSALPDWPWTPPKTVSGRVARSDTYGPVPSVTVSFAGVTGYDDAAATDSNGVYVITLPRDWAGVATPSYAAGAFNPTERVYIATDTNDFASQDYLWTPPGLVISGTVVDNNGAPLVGALLTLANAANASPAISNAPVTVASGTNGLYAFTVPLGWSGTVTPAYSNGNFFLPPSISYAAITNNQAGQEYQWFPPSYVAVSGAVLRADNSTEPVSGAAVVFLGNVGGSVSVAVAYSDVNGNYMVYVPRGWSGATILSDPDGGTFFPPAKTYTAIGAPTGPDFYYWLPPQNLSVSGRVIFRDTGLPAVGVTLSTSDSRSMLTDTNGVYSFAIPYLWSGTLTPSHARGGIFLPGSDSIPPVHRTVSGVDFSWMPPTPQLSGRVVSGNTGLGLAGVTVALSDGSSADVTDSNGMYRVILPWRGWSGQVIPSLAGGAFTPPSITVTTVVFDASLPSFVWLPAAVLTGHVTRSDYPYGPVAGAAITLSGGAGVSATDTNGAYTLLVPQGWSGVATPSHPAGGVFTPPTATYSSVGSGPYVQDYRWTPFAQTVSGRVVRADNGAPVTNATLTFSNDTDTNNPPPGYAPVIGFGGLPVTVQTDTNGNYGVSLPFGWWGWAVPSDPFGGSFSPATNYYFSLNSSHLADNYVWTPPPPSIAGRVLRFDNGAPVAGISLIFSNDETLVAQGATNPLAVATTDSNGNYRVSVGSGWIGTVTPVFTQYTGAVFAPVQHAFKNVQADVTDTNLTQFVFYPTTALLIVQASPASRGTVAGAASGWYTVGASLSIIAMPYSGSRFVQWQDGVSSAARTVVLAPGTNTYTATFADVGPVITFSGFDSSGGINFGDVLVGKSVSRTLVVKNTGTSVCTVMGATPPTCYQILPSSYVLNPGGSRTVTVVFKPVALLGYTGTVVLATNPNLVGGAPSFSVQGAGQELADALSLSGSADFGTMLVGQSSNLPLRIYNNAAISLSLNAKWSKGTDYSVSGFPVTVPAGGSRPFTLRFAPKTAKDYGGAMLVVSAAGVTTSGTLTPTATVVANVAGTWTTTLNKTNYTLYLRQTAARVDGMLFCKQNAAISNQYVAAINLASLSGAFWKAGAPIANSSLAGIASGSSLTGALTCAGIGTNLKVKWSRSSTSVPKTVVFLSRPASVAQSAVATVEVAPVATIAVPSYAAALRVTLLDLAPAALLPEDAELVVVTVQDGRPVAVSPALALYNLAGLLQTRIEAEGADANTNGIPDAIEAALGAPLQEGMQLLIVRKRDGYAVPEAPYSGTAVDDAAVPLGALPATWSLTPKQP